LAEKTAARESLLKKLTPLFRVKSRERKRGRERERECACECGVRRQIEELEGFERQSHRN